MGAMRCKYTRNCERFNQGTKELEKLEAGDSVIIQNQNGRHPTRWEKTGRVVEVLKFDQYIVKVNGSGRLTRRNRRFLRKFEQSPYISRQFTDLVTPENHSNPAMGTAREAQPRREPNPVSPMRENQDEREPIQWEPIQADTPCRPARTGAALKRLEDFNAKGTVEKKFAEKMAAAGEGRVTRSKVTTDD